MNKYVIPICDIQAGQVYNKVIVAKSYNACQDKLMEFLINEYDCMQECLSYQEFVELADDNDILIGKITDIEIL